MKKRDINNYSGLEVSTVSKMSDGTQFVSIGSFEYVSVVSFKFNVSELFANRLKEVGVQLTDEIEFINIIFRVKIIFNTKKCFKSSLKFVKCKFFLNPRFTDKTFQNEIRFRFCEFKNVNIINATFEGYVEFFNCHFSERFIAFKSNFNKNVTFIKSIFQNNCLFSYSTFDNQVILSRSVFKDKNENATGLDLSQSVINGQFAFFGTELGNYDAVHVSLKDKKYDELLESGENIPVQNKRETFRIIKHQLLQQNNVIDAEKYAKLEKQTLMDEMLGDFKFKNISNLLLLSANKISNNYKTNWLYGLAFLLVFTGLFHFLLVTFEQNYSNTIEYSFRLFSPADFSLFGKFECDWNYIILFFGKIIISYGIYQTIQAFRKYK